MKTLPIPINRTQPTEQQLLLLRAALLQGEPALDAWRAWRGNADLDQLPPGGFGLLPLLAYNLRRYKLTDPLLDKCQGIQRLTWTQNQLLLQGITPLLQRLQQAHITPMLGGDLALALLQYPEQGLRMINSIDLLTATSQPTALLPLFTEAGWQRQQTWRQALRARLAGGAQPQYFSHAQLRDVRLQWQTLASLPHPPLLADGEQQERNVTLRGVAIQCLSTTDLFFELCVHGISDLQWYGTMQWLADAGVLLQSAASAIDWVQLVERCRQQAMNLRMIAALDCLAQSIAAPIPAHIIPTLAAQPSHAVERWEAQLFADRPTRARKLAVLVLARVRQRLAHR